MRNWTMVSGKSMRRLLASGLATLVLASGCEMGRSHFQMNSNSMPFFGIDLLPRRSTTSIDPQSTPKSVPQSAEGDVRTASETTPKARSKFWNSFSFQSAHSEPTAIPLASPATDHPINRGPVELLP